MTTAIDTNVILTLDDRLYRAEFPGLRIVNI
jgi:hypothetical protein